MEGHLKHFEGHPKHLKGHPKHGKPPKNSPGFAQGVSDHELVQLLQQLFQHLLSNSALVFNRHFATIPQFSQLFYTKFEPSPFFSAKISNSASTAARTTVSCLYSAHARAPLQGPGGIGIGTCLTLVGHLFLKQFLKVFVHKNIVFLHKNHSEITTKSTPNLTLDFISWILSTPCF